MSCPSITKPKLVSMAAGMLVILVALFAGVETAPAQVSDGCMEDKVEAANGPNAVPLNCTAEDVRLGLFTTVGGPIECSEGELLTDVVLLADVLAGANERYDIGMFIALDNGDALRGSCYHDYLPPPLADINNYNPVEGPFYDAEITEDPADDCGDTEQGVHNFKTLQPISFICTDTDGDGYADLGTCTSWDNLKSSGTPQKPSCTAANWEVQTLPNTKSKCRCERVPVLIIVGDPEMTIVKSSATLEVTAAGQVVDYSYLVTNTGEVDLTGVTVTDAMADDPPGVTCDWANSSDPATPAGTLSVGETVTCSAQHTVTQAEMDTCSSLDNIGIANSDQYGPVESPLTIPIICEPEMTIDKDSTTLEVTYAGQVVDYSYLVQNTGNVTLTNVVVSDATVDDPPGVTCDWANSSDPATPAGTLSPGETVTCSAQRTVTQAEIDACQPLANIGVANSTEFGPVEDPHSIPVICEPGMTIVKSSATTLVTAAGQVVDYSYLVENTGNVTLTNVIVTDAMADDPPGVVCDWAGSTDPATPAGVLSPSEQVTCNAQHTVTQAEMDEECATETPSLDNIGVANSTEYGPVEDDLSIPIECPAEFQGCTPGYWKQEHHFDSWVPTGYSPSDSVGSVFTNAPTALAGDSLVDALDYPGGPGVSGAARILLRAAVAALLNAAHDDLNYEIADPADVIDAVNQALASGNRGKMLEVASELDGYNNAGCFDDMEEEPEVQPSPAPQAPGIKTTLGPAYPNPLNPDTWIPFRLAEAANVNIEIYDVTGRLVRRLDLGYRPAGSYWDRSRSAYWDGRNEAGESVSSGIYFYKMTAGDFSAIKRMVILK